MIRTKTGCGLCVRGCCLCERRTVLRKRSTCGRLITLRRHRWPSISTVLTRNRGGLERPKEPHGAPLTLADRRVDPDCPWSSESASRPNPRPESSFRSARAAASSQPHHQHHHHHHHQLIDPEDPTGASRALSQCVQRTNDANPVDARLAVLFNTGVTRSTFERTKRQRFDLPKQRKNKGKRKKKSSHSEQNLQQVGERAHCKRRRK
jgi:hypothetical protein